MDGTAVILTAGLYNSNAGKTAHGLVRGTERYDILGVIDSKDIGKDAGIILDGQHRGIPIFASLEAFVKETSQRPDYAIIGIASSGGKIPEEMYPVLKLALSEGISLVSGLHEFLSEMPDFIALAEKHGAQLIDVRKPKHRKDLHFWTGEIKQVSCPKIAVMGVDCAVGKRTTARFLTEAARRAGLTAEMIYTGQTGWLQGNRYGFILDSTVNDFVSGELEHAIVSCYKEQSPDMIFVEGQAALRNPSGPCGAEFLVSGQADGVVLQAIPARKQFKGWGHLGFDIPPIAKEIALIEMFESPVIAVTINSKDMSRDETMAIKQEYEAELGIPVLAPLYEGLDSLIPLIQGLK
ncbi:MAG: DUF1611 domain-containing protein [Bacteroidota bacterium]